MKKTFLLLFLAALVVIAVGVALFMAFMYPRMKEQAELEKLQINEVELADVQDGTYMGDFTFHGFTYEVEVIVLDHEITQVKVLKNIEDDEYAQIPRALVLRCSCILSHGCHCLRRGRWLPLLPAERKAKTQIECGDGTELLRLSGTATGEQRTVFPVQVHGA